MGCCGSEESRSSVGLVWTSDMRRGLTTEGHLSSATTAGGETLDQYHCARFIECLIEGPVGSRWEAKEKKRALA